MNCFLTSRYLMNYMPICISSRTQGEAYAKWNLIAFLNRLLKVQHLIEKCLIFRMSKEECMDALSKHANIKPVITSTVWKELEKENKEFFESYSYSQSQSSSGSSRRLSKAETDELIEKMISDNQSNNSDKDDDDVIDDDDDE